MTYEDSLSALAGLDSCKSIVASLWRSFPEAVIVADADRSNIILNPIAEEFFRNLQGSKPSAFSTHDLLEHLDETGLLSMENASVSELIVNGMRLALEIFAFDNGMHLIIIRDLDAGKTVEERLERLTGINSELNEIIELSADGLVSVDHDGIIRRANSAYKRILGIENEDLIGKPAQFLVEKGYVTELVSPHVLRERKSKNIVVLLKGKEVLLTGRPVFDDLGRVVRVVANIRDLTELNDLKSQLQKYHELTQRYETEIHHLRAKEIESGIIGNSPGTLKMIELAGYASKVDSTVLVYGETGTGKEMLVKSIHRMSDRREGPFIAINCSSIPESLIESELFGYEPGAFTGSSKKGKIGLFEAADQGTLFLDEISEMSVQMQTKVLRVLQERKVRRIGSNRDRNMDVRIIAASNKRLRSCIEGGNFRSDLYYRLNIINIDIPPLRERREDIPLLINYFLDKYNKKFDRRKTMSEREKLILLNYDWPGNIRELENLIERFVVLSSSFFLESSIFKNNSTATGEVRIEEVTCLKSAVRRYEDSMIVGTYERLKSTRKTAKALNVSQSTVVRKLAKFNKAGGDS